VTRSKCIEDRLDISDRILLVRDILQEMYPEPVQYLEIMFCLQSVNKKWIVTSAINNMVDRGEVEKLGRGLYRWIPPVYQSKTGVEVRLGSIKVK